MFGSAATRGRGNNSRNRGRRNNNNNANAASGGWGSAAAAGPRNNQTQGNKGGWGNNNNKSKNVGWGASSNTGGNSTWGSSNNDRSNNGTGWTSNAQNSGGTGGWGTAASNSRGRGGSSNRGRNNRGRNNGGSQWGTSQPTQGNNNGWGGAWGQGTSTSNNQGTTTEFGSTNNSGWGSATANNQQPNQNSTWGNQTATSHSGNQMGANNYQRNISSLTLDGMGEVSSLSWSSGSILACGSWDGIVRLYSLGSGNWSDPSTVTPMIWDTRNPVLDTAFVSEGSLVAAEADGKGLLFDIQSGTPRQVAQHESTISSLAWIGGASMLVTGGWDKTLRYWDLRQPQPVAQVELPDRCYSIGVGGSQMIVATAERQLLLFDLSRPQQPVSTTYSPLLHQTRSVSIGFSNGVGQYAVASAGGSVSLNSLSNPADAVEFQAEQASGAAVTPVNQVDFVPNNLIPDTLGICTSSGGISLLSKLQQNLVPIFSEQFRNFSADRLAIAPTMNAIAVGLNPCDDWTLDMDALRNKYSSGFGAPGIGQGKVMVIPLDKQQLEQTRQRGGITSRHHGGGGGRGRGRGRGGRR